MPFPRLQRSRIETVKLGFIIVLTQAILYTMGRKPTLSCCNTMSKAIIWTTKSRRLALVMILLKMNKSFHTSC